jgi:hypothetical protein
MTDSTPTRKFSIWRFLLRFLFVMILLALIVVGAYFALPYLYRELMTPVQDTSTRLTGLEERVEDDQARLAERLTEAQARLDDLQATLGAQSAQTNYMQATITPYLAFVEYQATQIGQLQLNYEDLATQNMAQAERLAYVEETMAAFGAPLNALQRETVLMRAMGLVTRAQIYLAQNNFGLALEQVDLARRVLRAGNLEGTEEWLAYLDQASGHLPNFPILAASELELAWQMMSADGLPVLPTLANTPTPTLVLDFTPTPTPTTVLDLAPTPTAYETPTPTPVR